MEGTAIVACGNCLVVDTFTPETAKRRVLLVNPPVYDTRFPWSQWQQPVALLQLATLLKSYNCDVRLLDAVATENGDRLPRRQVRVIKRGDVPIRVWRYGVPPANLAAQLKDLAQEDWQADEVYVEGFVTYWWEGVAEAVALVRQHMPRAKIVLLGAYPRLATQHAISQSGADVLVTGSVAGIAGLPLDLSICKITRSFSYISIGSDLRTVDDVIAEAKTRGAEAKRRRGVHRILFADHDVLSRFPDHVRGLLEWAASERYPVAFHLLGNVYPRDLRDDPEIAALFLRAGVKQVVFADDRDLEPTPANREQLVADYAHAVQMLGRAGYTVRSEAVAAMVSVGRVGEQLEAVSELMTRLAHVVGSVIPVPYQPAPNQLPAHVPLELHNGKIFPLAEQSGHSYRSYQDLIGLAALLNAKYRNTTFDFLGDDLISRLVRHSLAEKTWDPRTTGSLVPRKPIVIGYFNKEGKWVRS